MSAQEKGSRQGTFRTGGSLEGAATWGGGSCCRLTRPYWAEVWVYELVSPTVPPTRWDWSFGHRFQGIWSPTASRRMLIQVAIYKEKEDKSKKPELGPAPFSVLVSLGSDQDSIDNRTKDSSSS